MLGWLPCDSLFTNGRMSLALFVSFFFFVFFFHLFLLNHKSRDAFFHLLSLADFQFIFRCHSLLLSLILLILLLSIILVLLAYIVQGMFFVILDADSLRLSLLSVACGYLSLAILVRLLSLLRLAELFLTYYPCCWLCHLLSLLSSLQLFSWSDIDRHLVNPNALISIGKFCTAICNKFCLNFYLHKLI